MVNHRFQFGLTKLKLCVVHIHVSNDIEMEQMEGHGGISNVLNPTTAPGARKAARHYMGAPFASKVNI